MLIFVSSAGAALTSAAIFLTITERRRRALRCRTWQASQ